MRVSVAMPPSRRSGDLAALAEQLGYDGYWMYDSAALYEDIWIRMADAGRATSTIELGTAVLVPNLRHVMTTASAIATMAEIAPGRCAYGFGTGFTARAVLDQPALTWKFMQTYLGQLKGLLAGEVVEIDGRQCQMIHHPDEAVERPIDVSLLLSAFGPKGQAVALEMTDGVFTMGGGPVEGAGRNLKYCNGTVLDPGEAADSDRVQAAVGPWHVLTYHAFWMMDPAAVDGMPGGAEWRAQVEADRPEGQRHLAVHEGHLNQLMPRDAAILSASAEFGPNHWVGTADEIAGRVDAAAADGFTEVVYAPVGPDIEREMAAFISAARGQAGESGGASG